MPPTGKSTPNPTMAPIDTSNANLKATSIDTSNANPQKESPLFTRVPGEIRDHIFDLALTAYSGKQEPFAKDSYYYRPGFRYADQKLDTALLRTCRRIYQEAYVIPFENYECVEWHERERGPSSAEARRFARGDASCPWLTSLHLFTQQFWLEDSSWPNKARNVALRQKNLRHLKITIRHSDWWWWESSAPLILDAKHKGTKGRVIREPSTAADGFHVNSWGHQFSVFKGLETFELELETVEGKRKELNKIVTRAADWRLPLGDGNVLVLNPARTKRTGWHGLKLRECFSSSILITRNK